MADLSLADFMSILTEAEHRASRSIAGALEQAARVVEKEAKSEIGVYQDAAPPFAAWPELATSTKAERVRLGYSEDEPLLRHGDLRESISHHVEGMEAVVGSSEDIAVFMEMGTQRTPPRSFLGGAGVRKCDEVVELIASKFKSELVSGSGD